MTHTPTNLQEYSDQFRSHHPDTGEVRAGSVISGEQAMRLGLIFGDKVHQLTVKPALTEREATFVDRVVDLGSRSIVWALGSRRMNLPQTERPAQTMKAVHRLQDFAHITVSSGWDTDSMESQLEHQLESLSGGSVSMRRNPASRPLMEDLAIQVMPLLGEIAGENSGLAIDEYLAGNLQNLLAHFEMVEAEAAAANMATRSATSFEQ